MVRTVAALAFDDSGGQWSGKQGMWGPTGTGYSNAYFVASLSYIWGGTGPPGTPCRAATGYEAVTVDKNSAMTASRCE